MWELVKVYLINVACTLCFLFIIRIFIIYLRIHNPKKLVPRAKFSKSKLMVILGSGGHTFEMLRLIEFLSERYRPRVYVIADTDDMSQRKLEAFEQKKKEILNCKDCSDQPELYTVEKIPRSREVHQSWLTSAISTVYSCFCAIPIMFKSMPDAILCNGPGTCVPLCVVAYLLHVWGIKHIKIIYVESICRVTTLSFTGKIVYHLSDYFLVQWPELKKQYPRSKCFGGLV